MLQGMGGDPGTPATPPAQTRFSADGFWWWDGSAWKPAYSEDRLWHWNGQAWEPARPAATRSSGGGAGAAIGITVAIFVAIVGLVAIFAIVVLATMGNQIGNVFENVAAALTATPSP
jgi:Flp pilus assembly pilin Flp